MKIFFAIFIFTTVSLNSISQNVDTLRKHKWVNFSRIVNPGYGTNENWNRNYVTDHNDSLERSFQYTYTTQVGAILYETNYVNGKRNGLKIGYHSNGRIYSIDYFLNDKIWETNLLADSLGNQHDPGNLLNGTGQMNIISDDGQDLGYSNFKNGNPNGDFVKKVRDGDMILRGQLLYKPELIKYINWGTIDFVNENNDTLRAILFDGKNEDDSISNSYVKQKEKFHYKIILKRDFLDEPGPIEDKNLWIYLDPGVVPVGDWKLYNAKENKIYITYKFDEVGKIKTETNHELKLLTEFNDDGSVKQQRKIPN